MRTLGIDFGEKRIGLAISDEDGRVAVPVEPLERSSDREAIRQLTELLNAERVERVVLGEPRRLDGTRGEAAERVRRFAARLERATGRPVELVDEALTSVEAESRLAAGGRRRRRRRGWVDSLAAQILLQESLDRNRRG